MTAAEVDAWDEMVALLRKCKGDPVRFHRVFLDRPPLWSRQQEICRSLVEYRTTVCYSGNGVGKDFVVGTVIPWWLTTRPDSLLICTGPSQTVLGSITFREVRKALDHAVLPSGMRLSQGIKASPQVVEVAAGWHALGFSTTGVERASGQHAGDLLVIVEEASGVDDEIWDAIDSLNFSRLFAVGNPIRGTGRFVDMIRQSDRDRRDGIPGHRAVNAIRIPSTESPHAHLERSPVGLADGTWLEDVARRYGVNSLWYKSHVLALIPEASADVLIPQSMLDYLLAQPPPARPPGHPIHQTRRISCDLSEGVGRDSTCVLVRDDWGTLDVAVSAGLGLPEAAALIGQKSSQWRVPANRITYDRGGIGKNMDNHLRRLGIEGAIPYVGAGSPSDPSAYANLRTECGWRLRNRLDTTWMEATPAGQRLQVPFHFCPGPYIERLREDLRPLTYSLVNKAIKLMNKEDHMAALGRSPDVFDAICQSMYL
jgi:hypothetical protein